MERSVTVRQAKSLIGIIFGIIECSYLPHHGFYGQFLHGSCMNKFFIFCVIFVKPLCPHTLEVNGVKQITDRNRIEINDVILPDYVKNKNELIIIIFKYLLEKSSKDDIFEWVNLIFGEYQFGNMAFKKKNSGINSLTSLFSLVELIKLISKLENNLSGKSNSQL